VAMQRVGQPSRFVRVADRGRGKVDAAEPVRVPPTRSTRSVTNLAGPRFLDISWRTYPFLLLRNDRSVELNTGDSVAGHQERDRAGRHAEVHEYWARRRYVARFPSVIRLRIAGVACSTNVRSGPGSDSRPSVQVMAIRWRIEPSDTNAVASAAPYR
jgi:hypothetical protein